MRAWKDRTGRERSIIVSYLVIAIPLMVASMLWAAMGFGVIFSLGPDDPISMPQLIIFTAVMVAAIIVGLAFGGWIWLYSARYLLGFERSEIECAMADGPPWPAVSKYNAWCLDRVFGKQHPWQNRR